MEFSSLATSLEQNLSQQYDRQRRLRLTRLISQVFIGFVTLFLLLLVLSNSLYPPRAMQTHLLQIAEFGVTLVLLGCYVTSLISTIHQRLEIAVGALTAGLLGGSLALNLVWSGLTGINVFSIVGLMSLGTLIVFAGAVAGPWLIIGITLTANIFTMVLLTLLPKGPLIAQYIGILSALIIILHWSVSGLSLVIWNTYQQTLRDLGDVQMAYARAKQLDRLKDQFITNVNHELRTPIMTMKGYIELLTLAEYPPERQKALLQRANHAGESLVALINNILSVRELTLGNEAFTPAAVDVRKTLRDAIQLLDTHDEQAIPRDLQVQLDPQLMIWGEAIWLQQILTNLLSNAIKYSPAGTVIEIQGHSIVDQPESHMRRKSKKGEGNIDMAEITVRDHGFGIPPEQIPLLFNRFMRLPRDLASSILGNGLGLYLCRSYTERMGGKIWVESSGIEGEGCTFHVRLPFAASALLSDTNIYRDPSSGYN